MTHGGVRWKTCICPTSGWILGTNWIAEAPVPITATRSPSSPWSWSQRGGVEGRALEAVEAGQVGHERVAERPLGGDQHVGA